MNSIKLAFGFLCLAFNALGAIPLVEAKTLPEVMSLSDSSWENQESSLSSQDQDNNWTGAEDSEVQAGDSPPERNDTPLMTLFQKVDSLQAEIRELRGRLEEQNYRIEQLSQAKGQPAKMSLKTQQTDPNLDLPEIAQVNAFTEEQNKAKVQMTSTQEQPLSAFDFEENPNQNQEPFTFSNETNTYQKAYELIQSKNYDNALMALKSQVKNFPEGEHAPDAHYWMGEIYMLKGELDLAANEFTLLFQNYPQYSKASDALLKLGYVEYAKGRWKRSQDLLSQVRSQYPGTASARLAETRLQRMHQEGKI